MPKKNIVLLSIFFILFPFVFQIGIRGLFIVSFFDGYMSVALQTEIISLILFSIIFGRLYCGSLCQIEALQRLQNWIGIKIFKKRFVIPEKLDRYFRYLKYLFLLSVIFISVYRMEILYNPYFPIEQFSEIFSNIESVSWVVVGLTVVGGFLFNNFFCKYLCVQGAITALAGRLSRLRLKLNKEECIGCRMCDKKCPVNIEVNAHDVINSRECLYCYSCILACPKKDVLGFYFFGKKVKYSLLVITGVISYIVLVFIISFLFSLL
jgi:polyferredoxin